MNIGKEGEAFVAEPLEVPDTEEREIAPAEAPVREREEELVEALVRTS
jgi:hypothetical protein